MNRDAFLRAICEAPEDDAPRLIFADWLDDQGENARAEFIRLSIEMAKYKTNQCPNRRDREMPETLAGFPIIIKGDACGKCRWCGLRNRTNELAQQHLLDWIPECAKGTDWEIDTQRGFIFRVKLSCGEWLEHGLELLRECPLETVRLSDLCVAQHVMFTRGNIVFVPEQAQNSAAHFISYFTDNGVRNYEDAGAFLSFNRKRVEEIEQELSVAAFRALAIRGYSSQPVHRVPFSELRQGILAQIWNSNQCSTSSPS